jgi:hypothetical protein
MLCVSKLRPRMASTTEEDWNASCLKKTLCIARMLVKRAISQLRHLVIEKYLTMAFKRKRAGSCAGNWILSRHNRGGLQSHPCLSHVEVFIKRKRDTPVLGYVESENESERAGMPCS